MVANKVDKLQISPRAFRVLRLHGDTGALIAGSLATLLLLYTNYRAVLWRCAKMVRERRLAEEGTRAVWMGPGRIAQRVIPLHPDHGLCNDCAERPPQQQNVFQGQFQPA